MAIFEDLTPGSGIRYGKEGLAAGEANMIPGLLGVIQSDNTVDLASASTRPDGFVFGDIGAREYRSTKTAFAVGDEITLLTGQGMAALSADFFSSGSLPSAGAALYSGANGKLATSGSYKVAECWYVKTAYAPTGGTGTGTNVAIVRFNFDSYS